MPIVNLLRVQLFGFMVSELINKTKKNEAKEGNSRKGVSSNSVLKKSRPSLNILAKTFAT